MIIRVVLVVLRRRGNIGLIILPGKTDCVAIWPQVYVRSTGGLFCCNTKYRLWMGISRGGPLNHHFSFFDAAQQCSLERPVNPRRTIAGLFFYCVATDVWACTRTSSVEAKVILFRPYNRSGLRRVRLSPNDSNATPVWIFNSSVTAVEDLKPPALKLSTDEP